jgi:hypothetical protein
LAISYCVGGGARMMDAEPRIKKELVVVNAAVYFTVEAR